MSDPIVSPTVVFIHGLWLHATSWQPWMELFGDAITWLTQGENWTDPRNGILLRLWEHVTLSIVAIVAATLIALPIGLWIGHTGRGAGPVIGVANIGRAVPSVGWLGIVFPIALDPFTCNRFEMAEFTKAAVDIGVRYIGVCCGAMPHHIRAVAEALGRKPPASRYSADMSKHAFFGTDPTLLKKNQAYAKEL